MKYKLRGTLICLIISILSMFLSYKVQEMRIENAYKLKNQRIEYTYKQEMLKIWSDIGYNMFK